MHKEDEQMEKNMTYKIHRAKGSNKVGYKEQSLLITSLAPHTLFSQADYLFSHPSNNFFF
jgi:hypothetical protein